MCVLSTDVPDHYMAYPSIFHKAQQYKNTDMRKDKGYLRLVSCLEKTENEPIDFEKWNFIVQASGLAGFLPSTSYSQEAVREGKSSEKSKRACQSRKRLPPPCIIL